MNEFLSNSEERSLDKLNYYQAANSDHETIKANYVIRLKEFEIIINSLTNKSEKDPLQHELILGRRGSGKSTLLKRIEIELLENKALKGKYIPINLAEEQVGIYRLFDLWEMILTELKSLQNTELNIKNYKDFSSSGQYTRYLFEQIHDLSLKSKKRIILLLDNFDRIVENLSDDGKLLREILINYNDIGIIGASTRMDEHFWKYDMPFYEFFRVHNLGPLSTKEIINLLYHWSKVLNLGKLREFADNNPGKIENIRILTDGLPRTLQFFVRYILNNDKLESYEYLKKLIDDVTPLYQERLNHLTPPQRKTIYEMAFIWEASSTGQLSEILKMESKLVSANLKYLTDKGITDKIATYGRNNLYRISERFFNLWIIMTQGNPDQKRKARWLSIFLENWYNVDQLKIIAQEHIAKLRSKSIDAKHALIFSKALSQSKYISLYDRDVIIELTSKIQESKSEKNMLELPEKFEQISNEIGNLIENKEYKKALKLLENIENEEDGIKFYGSGLIYSYLNQFKESEKYYLKAIEKGNSMAMYNLAILYDNQDKPELAEKYYLQAIEKGHSDAMNNLANLYNNQNKPELAEKYYLQAIEKGHSEAMYNLAILYNNQDKPELAEKYYLQAIEKGRSEAMYNLAILYNNQDKPELAEKYYFQAIEKGHSGAMNTLAVLYYLANDQKKEALEYSKMIDDLELKLVIEIWNGIFDNVEQRSVEILKENPENDFSTFISQLLVHQQYSLVHNLFTHHEIGKMLQDKYQVLYYVEQILNKNKDMEKILLKIPPELRSTVDEVREYIQLRERFYGYKK